MIEIIIAAGWPIWPIIFCSVISVAIIAERFYSLRREAVVPNSLLGETVSHLKTSGVTQELISKTGDSSPLGRVFVAGLKNLGNTKEAMKEAIEEAGLEVAHEMDRYLTTLGTIATMAPLLGLLGTIIGMIEIFGASTPTGITDPARLAHGISIALYNAAFGIIVAVPSLVFYRHFRSTVDSLIVQMELQAVKLVEMTHGNRAD
ncbi:MAG: MotA/TolQ/ExbB proton channel family protein [Betaproteobacteria bacterium]|nr:MotA/TolQ/ExbB proton channel family protein [Betaproteobacteria bacterium]